MRNKLACTQGTYMRIRMVNNKNLLRAFLIYVLFYLFHNYIYNC